MAEKATKRTAAVSNHASHCNLIGFPHSLGPDLIKAMDPSGAPLDVGQQATLAALATLAGGGAAGLAGGNVQAGATWAQNEALNNDGPHSAAAAQTGGVLGSFVNTVNAGASYVGSYIDGQLASAGRGAANLANQFVGLMNANSGQNPPTDPNNQLSGANNGGNPPATGGALVTPPVVACGPGGCVVTPPVASPGTPGYRPSNAILSSGNDTGSGATGQGPSTNSGETGTVWDSITATQPNYPGSVIPQSFEMSLPNGQSVWVHGNATEHIAEYAQMVANNNPPSVVQLTTQQQLSSLQSAVNTATQGGVPYNQLINVGGWELKFAPPRQPGQLPMLST